MKKITPSVLLMVFVLTTVAVLSPTAIAGTSTWVIMFGQVNSYGGTPALGCVWAEAIIGNWAKVFGGFIPGIIGPPFAITLPFSFYAINLTSTTTAALNYSGNDFYVSGNWTVYNVTIDLYGVNITTAVDDGPGNLTVTGNWTFFTIDITGIDLIGGIVLFDDPIDESIPRGDVTGEYGIPDRAVDIWDLVHVAKAYGSDVTSLSYWWVSSNPLGVSFFVDFDFNWQIDLLDLTTVAANLGETY